MSRKISEEQQNQTLQTPLEADVIEKDKIRISVRNLVEFVFRSGDIDNRIGAGAVSEAMLEGSRMHRKIQKRMGSDYRAEVSLKYERIMGHYVLSLEGRADGIFFRKTGKEADMTAAAVEVPGMEDDTGIFLSTRLRACTRT